MRRRDFMKALLAGCLIQPINPSIGRSKPKSPRIVILGFDGVDPRLAQTWMQSGDLPNLMRLARQGGFSALQSTNPPNSPVAWSTFATGLAPTEHGIFGFLQRNPKTYLPATAAYTISPPVFSHSGYRAPQAKTLRKATAFWEKIDASAIPVTLLSMPYAYPPPRLQHGRALAGLGLPDLRFTNSSYTLYTTEKSAKNSINVAGGRHIFLSKAFGSKFVTTLEGPRGPGGGYLQTPLTLQVDKSKRTIAITIGKKTQVVSEGQRSQWFPVTFDADGIWFRGRVRFRPLSLRNVLNLYASPIYLDPKNPVLPLGSPKEWVIDSLTQIPDVPTIGWAHDTSAVNSGVLTKEAFLEDLLTSMHAKADLLLRELESGFSKILIGVFTGTDRASHIFFQSADKPHRGPLLRVYKTMDQIIGRVMQQLDPKTRLVVMSDHGFHPFDRMLHTNTWLEAQGLLTRKQPDAKIQFLRGIDWSKTKAYSIDTGQIYINLKGREAQGIVQPGGQYAALLDAISNKLLDVKDPKTATQPVRAVYPVANRASKDLQDKAPDLQIGFAPGYRSSWETSLGGAPQGDYLAPNPKAWRADHAASDFNETPGMLAVNTKLANQQPNLIDFAPSIFHWLGMTPIGSGNLLTK